VDSKTADTCPRLAQLTGCIHFIICDSSNHQNDKLSDLDVINLQSKQLHLPFKGDLWAMPAAAHASRHHSV
jgi:hypothetical protein